jgi:hypothetical protein
MRVRRDRVAAGRASMQNPERLADAGRFSARDQSTLLASAFYVALVGAAAWITGSQPLAVYALGFWHYYLYGLAYRYGAVPLPVFKRDAVLMKTIALAALASAYLAAPLDYAVISHPMLLGNMLAYGGTLLNAGFREQWWPLACAHVALNLGLLVMERRVTPLRRAATGTARPPRPWSWPRALWLSAAGAALGIGAAQVAGSPSAPFAAALGATVVIYGYTLYCAYTAPAPPRIDESGSTE